ncbi:HAD-IIIA family hydrolase [Candidatus Pelagibacter sp.]|jgi:D-glycero-D-manno-heptose 1,7-bisphosphate phosphatase|nr:HAD-IIIA family hydrolase [Candidatus Pelagibacter sp.]
MVKTVKAVFLDRDGVLNVPLIVQKKNYAPTKLKDFRLYPKVAKFCKILKQKGFLLIVITNQPDYRKKKIPIKILYQMHEKLKKKIEFDDIYISLSSNPKNFFKKPNPGMLLEAKKKHNINFKKSYLIGDRFSDIEAARNVGCKAIFIDRKYNELKPSHQVKNTGTFEGAVKFILLR